MAWMVVFGTVVVSLALLEFYGFITLLHLESLRAYDAQEELYRLQGVGLFQDPNDLAVMIAPMFLFGLYLLTDKNGGALRILWALPLALFGFALILTHSRGGLLALAAGVGVYLWMRFGPRWSLVLGVLLAPVLLYLAAARQANMGDAVVAGTGQTRIQLWDAGLEMFKTAPLFGIGRDEFDKKIGHVAHNSYLQCFTELGAVGGLLFIGAVFVALSRLWALRPAQRTILDPTLARMHPFLFGGIAAHAMGMMSLSQCYLLPTYTLLGMSAVFVNMTPADPPTPPVRVDGRLLATAACIGVLFLFAIYVFVRVMVRY